jgi:hypothetical protein
MVFRQEALDPDIGVDRVVNRSAGADEREEAGAGEGDAGAGEGDVDAGEGDVEGVSSREVAGSVVDAVPGTSKAFKSCWEPLK